MNFCFGSIRAGSLLTSTMAAIKGLWVDTGRIAANQHNGRYQGISGRSDQDFQFSRINVRLRGRSRLLKRAIHALIDVSFRLTRSHSPDKKNPARGRVVSRADFDSSRPTSNPTQQAQCGTEEPDRGRNWHGCTRRRGPNHLIQKQVTGEVKWNQSLRVAR